MIEKDTFDEVDRQIVKTMAYDGRLSAAEIAERIGSVTERTVRTRLTSLIERRMLFLAAIPDPRASGDTFYADLRIETEPAMAAQVADKIVDYPWIDWVGYRGNDYDIATSIAAPGSNEVLKFVEELSRIPGVRSIKMITYLAILKSYGFRLRAADELREHVKKCPSTSNAARNSDESAPK